MVADFIDFFKTFQFMKNKLLIEVKNEKVLRLLHTLEELELIKVLKKNPDIVKPKLSDKYKDVFSKEDAKSFEDHTQEMRREWENI